MMMRLFISLCLLLSAMCLSAQMNYDRTCYFGFTFEVSHNPHWGEGEPVIVALDQFSNGAKAGLKVGDIIMEIDGKATYLRPYEQIASWLFDDTSREVSFTIRNLNNSFKEVRLSRFCRSADAISEEELADLYSLYSVESSSRRVFSLPLKIEAHPEADYSDYYTFDFTYGKNKPTAVDDYIAHQIEKELNARGLKREVNDPDILIQIYYSYHPNQNHLEDPLAESKYGEWRYYADLRRMEKVPVYAGENAADAPFVKGLIRFGFQFFEKKYIHPGRMTPIWDAHIQEYVLGNYSLENYCQMHVPLMVMAYPYKSPANKVQYEVDFRKYNYTGVSFSRKDMCTLESVDPLSPAFKAGLRQGDRVVQVNGISFARSAIGVENAYADFVGETMVFRNPTEGFYNEKVKQQSLLWDKPSYRKIAREFRKDRYKAGFSYLFSFEPFVNPKTPSGLIFSVERRGRIFFFNVSPEVRPTATIINRN